MDNYVGKRLDGRYEVQEIIGVGGMSVVYKAYDNIDDRIVAIKVLKDEFLANEDFRRRFKNESKAIAVLSHPNIVKVYDVSFGEHLQYIVMEYVDGITLKEYIQKQGAITWNDALFFMKQILKALQHAHDKGIVHRDIKPQNIILLQNGQIKVTDFGIARFSRSETKTMTESAIGSVHYISPEQARGEFTDERADIYSVGVVLYEMLTGKVPFEADSAVSVALMQLQKEAKRLTEINPDIPLGLEQIVAHAMQKNPQDRYQTATEMLFDIEEIINNPKTVFDYTYFVDKEPTKFIDRSQLQNTESVEEIDDSYDDEEIAYDPDRKKKIVTAVSIGVIILIAAIVLLVMGITGQFNHQTKSLDNFVGYSYDELISSGKYKYQFVPSYEKTNKYDVGEVISQTPEAGSKVLEGSTVTLVVATSVDDLVVPNVYGKKEDVAIQTLKNAGLINYEIREIASDKYEEGLVAYTDPNATSKVSADTKITIFVSTGPSTTTEKTLSIPDVTGLSIANAKSFLSSYGFTNVSYKTEDSEISKDVVISQSPSPGTSSVTSTSISLVVSSGNPPTTVAPKYTVTNNVVLPDTGKTDTLVIYVDDKQVQSKYVTLDGSSVSVDVDVKSGKKVSIKAKLKNANISVTKKVTVSADMDVDLSFSDSDIAALSSTTQKSRWIFGRNYS